jgi:glycosyltransferase involved in cell wall biosynthesis
MNEKPSLAVVTPVKNELSNLSRLIQAVEIQTHAVSLWVLVDDHSTDGSAEFLQQYLAKAQNIGTVLLVTTADLPQEYQLGIKYAKVISTGFNAIRNHERHLDHSYDYIGILDADCFIAPDYYERLLTKFRVLPKLGIASGTLYYIQDGKRIRAKTPMRWPRGGIRIWRAQCLQEAGYFMTKSADAVSSASAWCRGWHNQAFADALADTRPVGVRADPKYYGRSAYERFIPIYYMLLKSCALTMEEGFRFARDYFRGYMDARRRRIRAQLNLELRTYFRFLPVHYAWESLIVLRNQLHLARARRKDSKHGSNRI